MRYLQILVFALGLAALITAIFFVGTDTGLSLWRAGVAILLIDVVCIMLWPTSVFKKEATGS
jgi:hypothetical protein